MKKISLFVVISVLAGSVLAERIVYAYDNMNRLKTVNYENQAAVLYAYDKAHNLESYTVLTDKDYFRAFMFYLAQTGGILNYTDFLLNGVCFPEPMAPSIFNS